MLRSESSLSGSFSTKVSHSQRIPARKSESNLRAFNTVPSHHVTFADLADGQTQQQSAFSDDDEDDDEEVVGASLRSPRRLYERFLDSTPGVVRQGEGWGSLSSGKAMAKPSSIASLRERARMFLNSGANTSSGGAVVSGTSTGTESARGSMGKHAGHAAVSAGNGGGRNIVDLAEYETKRSSRDSKQLLRGHKGEAGAAKATGAASASGAKPNTPGASSVLPVGGTDTGVTGTNAGGQKGWGLWKGFKGLGKKGKGEA